MTQIARNLTDLNDGFLRGKRYLILDRDTKYSDAFRSVLVCEGIQVIQLPPTATRRNAQLLPSGRSLTNIDSFFGQFAGSEQPTRGSTRMEVQRQKDLGA